MFGGIRRCAIAAGKRPQLNRQHLYHPCCTGPILSVFPINHTSQQLNQKTALKTSRTSYFSKLKTDAPTHNHGQPLTILRSGYRTKKVGHIIFIKN